MQSTAEGRDIEIELRASRRTEPLWPSVTTNWKLDEDEANRATVAIGNIDTINREEEQELQECQSLAPEEEECIMGMKFEDAEVRSGTTI
jgi:hypothetical protein